MNIVGLDIGYSAVKATAGAKRVTFPSVVGSPDKPSFSLNGDQALLLQIPGPALIGQDAIEQSRFVSRREDRQWVQSEEWYILAMAALSELIQQPYAECAVVTGLPSAFYSDKGTVEKRLLDTHQVKREGRQPQMIKLTAVTVVPQPFGAILALCLNEDGRIIDNELATGNVGVVDIGGKTTNILSVRALREVARETTPADVGAWDIVRAAEHWLDEHCPGLDLRDHEVAQIIAERKVSYYGEVIDLGRVIDAIVEPMAEQVAAKISQAWNGAARIERILISGGGAHLLGKYLVRRYRHAYVLDDPVFANATGFQRFAQRRATRAQ